MTKAYQLFMHLVNGFDILFSKNYLHYAYKQDTILYVFCTYLSFSYKIHFIDIHKNFDINEKNIFYGVKWCINMR